jgi:hypothetical protein
MMRGQAWLYTFLFTFLDLIICDKFVSRPYFGDAETEITVQQGEAAFFNCHVFNLANQTVSWMRTSDGYPLFIGNEKYINDQRFELVSRRRGQNTLKLKFTNASDAGNFECQVSTNPKISQIFKLNIIVPSVSVDGQQEKHVMAGSPVELKCYIKNCLKQPTYVFWYMSGSRLLDSGGRVKVRTSMLTTGVTALSVLSIDKVDQSDRGNYTCKPASGGEASISLHVLEGEKPAGLHHDQTSDGNLFKTHSGLTAILVLSAHNYFLKEIYRGF